MPPKLQKGIALETSEIYAPLAYRLGMQNLSGELEDSAFPCIYPQEYQWLLKNVRERFKEREAYLEKVKPAVRDLLVKNNVEPLALISRVKRYASLYKKLLRYEMDIEKIYDLVALRIIVKNIADCYTTLGLIHKMWPPLPGRIKDYIAQPKPNNYQSLHKTVATPDGKIIEFQIRTEEMHEQAEYGIAAYWHYKEGGLHFFSHIPGFHPKGYNPPKKFQWIQELAEWQKAVIDNTQYLKTLKIDALSDRIFVFTPQGDVIDLPEDSTPIDFAYHIHTDIGDKCVGAKINGLMESLDTPLKNGDMVEIITDKSRKGPSRDWLGFTKTGSARNKIRAFFMKKT